MEAVTKYDNSKIITDCLGVLYLNTHTVYIKDFRKEFPEKARKLELFFTKNFTDNEIAKINIEFEQKTTTDTLPTVINSDKTDSFFEKLCFWCAYDLSVCYAYMYEPYKSIEYFEKSYLFSKKLKEVTIGQTLAKYGDKNYYQIDCLCIYKLEDTYKKIEPILHEYIDIECKIKWLFAAYYEGLSKTEMEKSCKSDKSVLKEGNAYQDKDLFQIQTKEQADNLLRYKRISNERYKTTIARIKKNEELFENEIILANNFKIEKGFKRVETEPLEYYIIKNEDYTPSSSWICDRYSLLSPAQKNEYTKLYYSDESITERVFKYERVRVNDILLYFFNNPAEIKDEELKNEIVYFSNFKNFKLFYILKEIYDYLNSLNKNELLQKIDYLLSLDDPLLNSRINQENISLRDALKRRITVSENYLRFIKQSNSTKELSLKTKKTLNGRLDYKLFLSAKDCFNQIIFESDEGKKYHDVFYRKSQIAPTEFIKICEDYIQHILDNKPRWSVFEKITGYSEESFHIGYIIDDLTGSCVKVKDWEKIIFWLDLFFNGEPIFSYGASKSIREKLIKRFENAKEKLNTIQKVKNQV